MVRRLVDFGWCDRRGVCEIGEVGSRDYLGLGSVGVSKLVEVDEGFGDW